MHGWRNIKANNHNLINGRIHANLTTASRKCWIGRCKFYDESVIVLLFVHFNETCSNLESIWTVTLACQISMQVRLKWHQIYYAFWFNIFLFPILPFECLWPMLADDWTILSPTVPEVLLSGVCQWLFCYCQFKSKLMHLQYRMYVNGMITLYCVDNFMSCL